MQPSHALSTAALLLAAGEPILGAPAVVNNIIIPYHTSSSSSSLSPSPRGRFSTTTRRRRLVPSSPPHVVKRAAYAVRANEIVDGETACRDVTVVYARGTTQNGNIGAAGDVGPVFMNALAGLVGAENIAVQGVEYDADISGFLKHLAGTGDEGVEHMASLVTQVQFFSFLFSRLFLSCVSICVCVCVCTWMAAGKGGDLADHLKTDSVAMSRHQDRSVWVQPRGTGRARSGGHVEV